MKKIVLAIKMLLAANGLYYMPDAKNRKLMAIRKAYTDEKWTVFASKYVHKKQTEPLYKEFTFKRRLTAARLAFDGKIIYNKDRK